MHLVPAVVQGKQLRLLWTYFNEKPVGCLSAFGTGAHRLQGNGPLVLSDSVAADFNLSRVTRLAAGRKQLGVRDRKLELGCAPGCSVVC